MTPLKDPALATSGVWAVDPARSSVRFSVQHLGVTTVHGAFETFAGALTLGPSSGPGDASGTVEAASVRTTEPQRDAFIVSEAFLEAERFPELRFVATAVRPAGTDIEVEGDLTIRETSRPLVLRGTVSADADGGGRVQLTGEVDRRAYGLRLRQGFGAADRTVSGQVAIELDLALSVAPG